jgi:hypothetical protein
MTICKTTIMQCMIDYCQNKATSEVRIPFLRLTFQACDFHLRNLRERFTDYDIEIIELDDGKRQIREVNVALEQVDAPKISRL